MRLTLKSQQLDQRAALASARSEYESARLQAEAERAAGDVIPALQVQRSELLAEQRKVRFEIETDRLAQFADTIKAQITAREAHVAQVRNAYERKQQQVDWLKVRAGSPGVVQQMLAEDGQTLALGQNIARVARPDDLRAEINIPETQARDVQLGQAVSVDTRNGIVAGKVVRIDPAVQQGTVQVDVDLVGPLPQGARPDLSVDGTIEIERLPRVLFTGRPAYGQPNSTVGLFKLVEDGRYAIRVPVEIGRTSVNAVEIVKGLAAGDQVILSDTSAWDDNDRIRLN
jgi:HlyD family secretion protein